MWLATLYTLLGFSHLPVSLLYSHSWSDHAVSYNQEKENQQTAVNSVWFCNFFVAKDPIHNSIRWVWGFCFYGALDQAIS